MSLSAGSAMSAIRPDAAARFVPRYPNAAAWPVCLRKRRRGMDFMAAPCCRSEHQLDGPLQDARIGCGRDLPESAGCDIAVRQPEVGMVQEVECLPAGMERQSFYDAKLSRDG